MGGETSSRPMTPPQAGGLSPRGRGNRSGSGATATAQRSIPAWAGKPLSRKKVRFMDGVYPRVGGETMNKVNYVAGREGLSPRGRGNRPGLHQSRSSRRSIPAWAGKPSGGWSRPHQPRVYPRVGGETVVLPLLVRVFGGLSPRGRGNPCSTATSPARRGSIPAWAGKPATPPRAPTATGVYPRVGGETREAMRRSTVR